MAMTPPTNETEEERRLRLARVGAPGDVTQAFGRAPTSGVEKELGTQALDLNFDPEALRTARRNVYEADVGQSREQMARQFAVTPGGMRTGAGENRFTGLETERLRGLQQIEADVAQMTPEQKRLNAQSLSGILGQREQMGLAERGQTEAERAAKVGEGLAEREFGLQTMDVLGRLTQDKLTAKIQRAATEADVTGTWTDPETGADKVTLQAELSRRQQDETERTSLAQERLAEGKLTGFIPGEQRISDVAMAAKLGLPPDVNRRELERQATNAGYTKDPFTGQYTAPGQETVESKATTSQIDLGERAMTMQESQQKFNNWRDTGTLTGNLALVDGNGEVVINPETNEPMTMATMAAQELALQKGLAVGKVGTDPTIQADALALEQEIQRGTLMLQKDAQAFGQDVTEADLTGMYKSMGMEDMGAFTASWGKKSGEAGYEARFDFDGDGQVSGEDWTEFANVATSKPVKTLAGQAMSEQKAAREFNETLAKAGVTGDIDGGRTVQERQRLFENRMTESEMFGGAAPVTFTVADLGDAMGSKKGEPKYRAELDVNGDGTINGTDQMELMNTDGNAELVGGSLDDPASAVLMYTDPGKSTIAAKALGIDRRKLGETARQFNEELENNSSQWSKEFNQSVASWKSDFGNMLVTDKGQAQYIYDTEAGEWKQPTTIQKQDFDEKKKDVEDRLKLRARSFANQNGVNYDDLTTPERMQLVQIMSSAMYGTSAFGTAPTKQTGWQMASGMFADLGPIAAAAIAASDRNIKTDIMPADGREVLDRLSSMPIATWKYIGDDAPHLGPMAQDFKDAFGLGDSDKHIHLIDGVGVAMAAIQALTSEVEGLRNEVARLKGR